MSATKFISLSNLTEFLSKVQTWASGAFAAKSHTHSLATTSIGSASAGTDISADDITAWTANIPTEVIKKTVVTSATPSTATYADGVLTISNGSVTTGDSVEVTAGTAASLSYTSRSIPNISVTPTTVATGTVNS